MLQLYYVYEKRRPSLFVSGMDDGNGSTERLEVETSKKLRSSLGDHSLGAHNIRTKQLLQTASDGQCCPERPKRNSRAWQPCSSPEENMNRERRPRTT